MCVVWHYTTPLLDRLVTGYHYRVRQKLPHGRNDNYTVQEGRDYGAMEGGAAEGKDLQWLIFHSLPAECCLLFLLYFLK